MKKIHSIQMLLAAAALLLATTACTKDESSTPTGGVEGAYPLQIARITLGVEGGEAQPWGTPATRVSEIADGTGSTFDAGDPFAVQIDGEGEVGTYTVRAGGSAEAETPLYWSDRDEGHTVTAWYPAKSGTLDLSDQRQRLAYLLRGTGTGNYNTPVTLAFTHRLAKVRVTPADDALALIQSLQLYTCTQCTHTQGTIVSGTTEGWVEMMKCDYTIEGKTVTCWEANVVPGCKIEKLMANNDGEERALSEAITPEAGELYDITLEDGKGYFYDGTTYIVTSPEGLTAVASMVRNGNTDANITLARDIDLTGIEWVPISEYRGIFDGNNHTITGLHVSGYYRAGLIIYNYGTVQNLTLKDIVIETSSIAATSGGVAAENEGTVSGCSVTGNITASFCEQTGGVVGSNTGTVIGCSHSEGTLTSGDNTGGVVGLNTGRGTVTACYATGNLTSGSYTGGVVGYNTVRGTVTACYHATGTVSGGTFTIGGVVGYNLGTLTACYWSDSPDKGISFDSTGETTQVDGDDVTWLDAVTQMNAALKGTGWRYEITDGNSLPTLMKEE